MKTNRWLVAVGCAIVLVMGGVAGCGDDDDDSGTKPSTAGRLGR